MGWSTIKRRASFSKMLSHLGKPVVGLLTLILLSAFMPVAPGATFAAPALRSCPPFKVYGLIGQRYNELGGSDSPLGCPLNDEADTAEGDGRYNNFENGVIVWTPRTGNGTFVAYQAGASIVVKWGSTDPFNYDTFLVRWDIDGQNRGQEDVWAPWLIFGGNPWFRENGSFIINGVEPGHTYRIVVEGCDYSLSSGHTCRQGWSDGMIVVTR